MKKQVFIHKNNPQLPLAQPEMENVSPSGEGKPNSVNNERLGGQITIQDNPVSGDQKQQTKLCSDPHAAVAGAVCSQLTWASLLSLSSG